MSKTVISLQWLSYMDVGATVFAICMLLLIGASSVSASCQLEPSFAAAGGLKLLWPSIKNSTMQQGQKALYECKGSGFGYVTTECQSNGAMSQLSRNCTAQPPVGPASIVGISAFVLVFLSMAIMFIHSMIQNRGDIVVDDKEK